MPEPAPQSSPADLEQAVGRLREMSSKIELFHAVRRIAENQALLSSKAVEQIRQLYADYDRKHPTAGHVVHQ